MTTTLVSKRLSGNNQPQLREFLAGDSARKQSTPRPSPRSYSERMRERLDSRHWQRQGWFQPGLRFESQWSSDGKVVASVNVCTEVGRMILSYVNRRNDGSWQNMEYGVSISWTRCHYGGARAWRDSVVGVWRSFISGSVCPTPAPPPAVLFFQFFQSLRLVHLQPAVFLPPTPDMKRLIAPSPQRAVQSHCWRLKARHRRGSRLQNPYFRPVTRDGAWRPAACRRRKHCTLCSGSGRLRLDQYVKALEHGHERRRGAFSIMGLYTCPSASAQMYLVATGGDSGAGTNSSLALMAALGSCGNLSLSTFVNIDEVTTVAAVYSLAPFTATNSGTPGASVGTSSTNSQGLTQAFATANNLVNTASGLPSGASLPAGATIPSAELERTALL